MTRAPRSEDYLSIPCDNCVCKTCYKRLAFIINSRNKIECNKTCTMCNACTNYDNQITEEEGCEFYKEVRSD